MQQSTKKLFLLDAMALIYRAYFAFSKNPRISSKGMNTSAIFGFVNTLLEILAKERPSHIAVAFDTKAPTLRHEVFAEYKAHRQEVPEDIIVAIPYIIKILDGFRIPVLMQDGYEADDIIGTMAKDAEKAGFKVYMVTPDKDFGQLVTENIFMYKPARLGNEIEILGVKEICEKFSIERPEQVVDLLGLWGDASDNIPGVPGIGEKKAKNLIKEFGTIEHLLANVHQVADKRAQQSLLENGHQAILSKQIAKIITDMQLSIAPDDLQLQEPDEKLLSPLFEELEFRTLASRVFKEKSSANETIPELVKPKNAQLDMFATELPETTDKGEQLLEGLIQNENYQIINTENDLQALLNAIHIAGTVCFDTETTGLDHLDAQIVGIAFCIEPGKAWYLPFPADPSEAKKLADTLRGMFENENIEKTGQNLKYDISVLKNYNISVAGKLFDTMLAHYLLEPDMRHNMDTLARSYLQRETVSIEVLIGKKGKQQLSMREIPIEKVAAYACEDADITLQLRRVFEPKLKESNLLALLYEVESPLIPVLIEMERYGVAIDVEVLKKYSSELEVLISNIEKEIFQLAGCTFNIGSPKQLGEVLFDRLKLSDGPKKTRTKQYSTGEEILVKLLNKHPIVRKILDYRSFTKLKSTYVDALPKLIHANTGRIHTSYNQAVAATGRLSSNNPNLQNIPIRSEEGRHIRKAFVPGGDGFTLLSADYSQIELRIIASLSGDEAMIDAFHQKLDIHTATAARIYEVELEDVTKEMRRNAKTVNFGIIYGISPFGLSERLGIPKQEAARIINQYFEKYSGIKAYMDDAIAFARKHEYAITLLGRRRHIADINSSNAMLRGYAERNAINAPVQGSAADLIKLAMIAIHSEMQKHSLMSKMTMQVHDELVFEVHKSEVELMQRIIKEKMQNALTLKVPLEVEMSAGSNWLEAH